MKDVKRVVRGAALVAAVGMLLASCGFLLPQRGRENPLDPNSPVALIVNFAAQTVSVEATTASVRLTWALPADRIPATVYIVRNENGQPRNRDDGLGMTAPADPPTFDDNMQPLPGKVYWYAAWCTVDDETYAGPVYARASTVVVAPLATFAAAATAPDTVKLTWTLPAANAPASIAIVRKDGADPAGPNDGTRLPAVMADGQYVDVVGEGNVYDAHYAAWAQDAERVRFVGPLLAAATAAIVSPISGFTAVAKTPSTVDLTWAIPATDAPAGLAVIRKEGSAPTSRTDGVTVAAQLQNLQHTDAVLSNKVYYYAAWGYDAAGLEYSAAATASASTVVPATLPGFAASATSASTVQLSWTVPTTNAPAGVVVVRKPGALPANPSDGTVIPVTLATGQYTDTTVAASSLYYYGAWGYNSTGYLFSDAQYDPANTTMVSSQFYPQLDGCLTNSYLFSGGQYDWQMLTGDQSGNTYLSLIKFAGVPPTETAAATLYLSCFYWWGYLTTIEAIAQNWDASVPYSTASGSSFISTAGAVSFTPVANGNIVDVTQIVRQWSSGTASYGVRMRSASAPLSATKFYTSEGGTIVRPYLSVTYSKEFAP